MIDLLARKLSAGDRIEVSGVPVLLRVNTRARRISLRIDPRARQGVATAPSLRLLPKAAAFARARADWLSERLAAAPAASPLQPGATIPFRGRPIRLENAPSRVAARLSPDNAAIRAGGEGEDFSRRILAFLRREAKAELEARTSAHAAALGLPTPQVRIGDARSRWGSCSSRGSIRYNWRLILAPPEVLDYVAAHECAHLVRLDHSPEFWAVVERLYGPYTAARRWLRTEGAALHAVG